jgi:hydrogenase maturation protease
MGKKSESTAIWNRRPRVAVVGLGNSILQDNGVGIHAVRRFQQIVPRPCLAVELGTAIYDSVKLFESADRILVFDSVEAGGKPGSVYIFRAEEIMEGARYASLREMELIKILQTLHRRPDEVLIVGAEPQSIDWGINLSPELEAAVCVMVSIAQKAVSKWKSIDVGRARIDVASLIQDSRFQIRESLADLQPFLKRSISA